ncbi:paeninodin family lasso peptide [Paenibacillus sp. MWE-103]|uniref:Paeninodin family lasso peptide n=1 Tax=Paenibacillus artemisiicola TaxID=1172618 RepID=A0ABS3WHJ3_9BACL|nr:paeninodin family lasso peptide [Paenibacillus artemisiicola]MBO7747789.1 paeninodin family lasso peptide [Paenibacillus artemisiicola]
MEKLTTKTWEAPQLEVLDVAMTMHGAKGTIVDKNRIDAKHPEKS